MQLIPSFHPSNCWIDGHYNESEQHSHDKEEERKREKAWGETRVREVW